MLKYLFKSLLLLSIYVICSAHSTKNYFIRGTIVGANDGSKVYVVIPRIGFVDSAIIAAERFSFHIALDEPTEVNVYLNANTDPRYSKNVIFWMGGADVTIMANITKLEKAVVRGAVLQKDYDHYFKEVLQSGNGTSYSFDSLTIHLAEDYIGKYPEAYKSVQQLFIYRQHIPFFMVKLLYDRLKGKMKSSYYGAKIKEFIANYKQLAINDQAPNFTLPDLNDHAISLESFKGKFVLLVFWSSSCAPCRSENPLMNGIYARYKGGNFEILGIGLDSKKDFSKAILIDRVQWTNVYDERAFYSPISFAYGVQGVPMNYLIDPDGKIRGINLEFIMTSDQIFVSDRNKQSLTKIEDLIGSQNK